MWSPFVIPLQRFGFIRQFNKLLLSAMLKFYMKRLGVKQEILWTYNPLTVYLLSLKGFDKVIYHCVDDIKSQPGMPVNIIEKAEQDLVKNHTLFLLCHRSWLKREVCGIPIRTIFPTLLILNIFLKLVMRQPVSLMIWRKYRLPHRFYWGNQ